MTVQFRRYLCTATAAMATYVEMIILNVSQAVVSVWQDTLVVTDDVVSFDFCCRL